MTDMLSCTIPCVAERQPGSNFSNTTWLRKIWLWQLCNIPFYQHCRISCDAKLVIMLKVLADQCLLSSSSLNARPFKYRYCIGFNYLFFIKGSVICFCQHCLAEFLKMFSSAKKINIPVNNLQHASTDMALWKVQWELLLEWKFELQASLFTKKVENDIDVWEVCSWWRILASLLPPDFSVAVKSRENWVVLIQCYGITTHDFFLCVPVHTARIQRVRHELFLFSCWSILGQCGWMHWKDKKLIKCI